MWEQLELHQGDITRQDVDAIVNAANPSLLGGGGVDGAIHRAAGPGLLAECRTLGGCPTGQAKITRGYDLRARHVIHTAGPIWHGGAKGEPDLLRSCYANAMRLAREHRLRSIAFPSISTGVYGYPIAQAAPIALRTVAEALADPPDIEFVRFVLFSATDFSAYESALKRLKEAWQFGEKTHGA